MRLKSNILLLAVIASLLTFVSSAEAEETKAGKRERVKQHVAAHLKPYGFVRNYFIFDSRENIAGRGDIYSYVPKDILWNQTEVDSYSTGIKREDLNANPSFRFLALTTRFGLNIVNYKVGKTEFSGNVEADFYAGLTGSTGVALLRLRHAYMTLAWDSLRIDSTSTARVSLLMGQTWHPMVIDMADVLSLNSGTPFNADSRTPQVRMDAKLGKLFTLTGAAMWQMQYPSNGPIGPSADYIKYSCTPEAFVGLSFQHPTGVLLRAGANLLSINPRHTAWRVGSNSESVEVKVNERITTASAFLFLQYSTGNLTLKAKTIFAQAGEHLALNGGYGVKRVNANGSWEYTPTRNLSSWICFTYGSRLKGVFFAGYMRNFGVREHLAVNSDGNIVGFWFSQTSQQNINRLWRLAPAVIWTIGRFQLGAEYEVTSAQYGEGEISAATGLASNRLHWVTNHRVQMITKFNF